MNSGAQRAACRYCYRPITLELGRNARWVADSDGSVICRESSVGRVARGPSRAGLSPLGQSLAPQRAATTPARKADRPVANLKGIA